jgi:hypothetical protein
MATDPHPEPKRPALESEWTGPAPVRGVGRKLRCAPRSVNPYCRRTESLPRIREPSDLFVLIGAGHRGVTREVSEISSAHHGFVRHGFGEVRAVVLSASAGGEVGE